MAEPLDEREDASALLQEAQTLADDAALPLLDDLVARFGQSPRADVHELVAEALLDKGLALDRLGRHDDEIAAYDELLRRFSASDDPNTVEHVAWAMYDKALALHHLDREAEAAAAYEQVVDRFGGATDPELRPRVSWSLWWLFMLGRRTKEEICRALVERSDDEHDPHLRDRVMFAYCTLGSLAHDNGDVETALRLFDATIARAGDSPNPDVRIQMVNALLQKAHVLEELNRRDEAITVYDDALATAAEASDPALREQTFRALTSKGLTLRNLERREEALVVVDGALQAYGALESNAAADARPGAVRNLFEKLQLLCELGRSDEAAKIQGELVDLLGDVVPPPRRERTVRPSDEEIAALLAELHAGDCWSIFESPPRDAEKQFEPIALDLYRRTDPVLQPPLDNWDEPSVAAASIIRQIADGFALLSKPSYVPLRRRLLEWAIRLAGVDEWAADLGHPLDLAEESEDIDDLVEAQPEPEDDYSDQCAAACVAAFYQRDLVAALCDSPAGREALHSSTHRWLAAEHLNTARWWGSWAFLNGDDALAATAAAILIAQGYYCASRLELSSAELTPSRETLSELLRQAEGRRWLEDRDFVLPDWLADDDD